MRQRPDKEISPSARVDAGDVAEVAALIDFVGVCRDYASELAINELTLRAYSDLQHYLENATKALIDSLRVCETRVLGFRRAQVDAGLKLCAVLFGEEYAQVMTKAADVALNTERKPPRLTRPQSPPKRAKACSRKVGTGLRIRSCFVKTLTYGVFKRRGGCRLA